jgi:hypothetical protein
VRLALKDQSCGLLLLLCHIVLLFAEVAMMLLCGGISIESYYVPLDFTLQVRHRKNFFKKPLTKDFLNQPLLWTAWPGREGLGFRWYMVAVSNRV